MRADPSAEPAAASRRPRLGFAGVGWIGRHRLQAIADSGRCEVAALADCAEASLDAAAGIAPAARRHVGFEPLLSAGLDGIVIATPSALHAEQAIAALESGMAVFCQKPLGRNTFETRRVVEAARRADRLLGVDLSYRHVEAIRLVRELAVSGELGDIFALELTFHNAYGPDKPWFYDAQLSGGGCVIDLGVHLVDLALWMTNFPGVERVSSRLYRGGRSFEPDGANVEDFANARLDLAGGASARIACSWNLHAGEDASIEAAVHGTKGGARVSNVEGSFYDFRAERFSGTRRETIARPPDAWGGRAAALWAARLAGGARFDEEIASTIDVANVLDRIYRPCAS